jgi:SOS response associated peptidase (SRAP)
MLRWRQFQNSPQRVEEKVALRRKRAPLGAKCCARCRRTGCTITALTRPQIWPDVCPGTLSHKRLPYSRERILQVARRAKWNKETGEYLQSCTMVLTEPNKFVAEMHDRMPVILEAKDFEQWERRCRGCCGANETGRRERAAEVASVAAREQLART